MEDLIYFLAFIVFAGISIVSKVVGYQKNQNKLTGGAVPQKQTPAKKTLIETLQATIQEAINPPPAVKRPVQKSVLK